MENFYYNTSDYHSALAIEYSAYQQDTVPKTIIRDTALKKTIPILINQPEKKSQDSLVIKKETVTPKIRLESPRPFAIDTTCTICPSTEPVRLASVFEQLNQQPFVRAYLYDKQIYQSIFRPLKPVFIETKKLTAKEGLKPLEIKSLDSSDMNFDWIFFPIIILVAVLGFIKLFFFKQIVDLFRSSTFFHIANKVLGDTSAVWIRLFLLLDLVYFLTLPLTVSMAASQFNIQVFNEKTLLIFSFYLFLGLIAYRIFRFVTIRAIGFLSNNLWVAKQIFINQLLYLRLLGLVIVPLNLMLAYTDGTFQLALFYITGFILGITLILRLIRTLQVFLFNRFSLLYFILYLCALEIIPILLIYKALLKG